MTHWTDFPYWVIKIYFSGFWIVWLASLYWKLDGNFMWNISGVLSLIFCILNLMWQIRQPSSVV